MQAHPARLPLSSTARMRRIVPSSGGQPLGASTPFAARSVQKASRDNGLEAWTPPSRKVQARQAQHASKAPCPFVQGPCAMVRTCYVQAESQSGGRSGRGKGANGGASAGRARQRGPRSSGGPSGSGAGRDAAGAYEGGSTHPARLLDREDARHYSGFLGQLSPSEACARVPAGALLRGMQALLKVSLLLMRGATLTFR